MTKKYIYLATSTQIGQTEISNASNTVLTFFQTSDNSKVFKINDTRNIPNAFVIYVL